MADFRSERMPSPEGHGNARNRLQRAWDGYSRTVNAVAVPALEPLVFWIARGITTDLAGFWLLWQLEGGFEGMQRLGMSRSAIYRRINLFRRIFGVHPDDFTFPGVKIDLEEYIAAAQRSAEERARSAT